MKSSAGRRTTVIAAMTLLAGGIPPATSAFAAPSHADGNDRIATQMSRELGSRSAGSYLDRKTGKLVVTVTSQTDAKKVRKAGAVPKLVARSGAQLESIKTELDRKARISGTAWGIDPVSDQVVVSVDSTVKGAKLAKVTVVAKRYGKAVRIKHIPGKIRLTASGGDAIWGGVYRCSLGFNVRDGAGRYYFLTAGHCGNDATYWYADQGHTSLVGTIVNSRFPGTDFALAQYAGGVSHPGTVGGQDITNAGTPYVGQYVARRGSSTGTHYGYVTALNQTVSAGGVSVYGETETNVCVQGGDSGGPFYAGSTALGITSAGNGDCTYGGTSWFQNVQAALNYYGVSVY